MMGIFNSKSEFGNEKSIKSAIIDGDKKRVYQLIKSNPALLNARIGEYHTPIKLASEKGHLEIVKMLVQGGAEVYSNPWATYPAVMDAAWAKQQHVVDYFLKEIPEKAEGTNQLGVAINLAARQGWIEIVEKHIKRDPLSVNQRGWIGDTPMHWASHNNYPEIVTVLLDNGADIEADEINWIGGRPLHWASEHAPETTKLLLERGAIANAINIKEGSKCKGRTPLIHNASQGEDCSEITLMLLEAGADPTLKESNGKTAHDVAKENGNSKILSILEKYI